MLGPGDDGRGDEARERVVCGVCTRKRNRLCSTSSSNLNVAPKPYCGRCTSAVCASSGFNFEDDDKDCDDIVQSTLDERREKFVNQFVDKRERAGKGRMGGGGKRGVDKLMVGIGCMYMQRSSAGRTCHMFST